MSYHPHGICCSVACVLRILCFAIWNYCVAVCWMLFFSFLRTKQQLMIWCLPLRLCICCYLFPQLLGLDRIYINIYENDENKFQPFDLNAWVGLKVIICSFSYSIISFKIFHLLKSNKIASSFSSTHNLWIPPSRCRKINSTHLLRKITAFTLLS
jgi:hypothetical protein